MKKNFIRLFDIIFSIIILIICFPLLVITFSLVYIIDGNPVIYKQTRIGIFGKKFKIYKFRTMNNIKHINKNLIIADNLRLTRLGKILRRLSVDELPQFVNVIKADMSIVGPRPLPELKEKKIKKKDRNIRRKIFPGITGMSQINYTGRARTLDEKVKLDIEYVKNYSLYNYFKIILRTPVILIIRLLKNKTSIIN